MHTNKLRYQLEVPQEIVLPKEFTRVGNKMRKERYRVVTTELTKLSAELCSAQKEFKEVMRPVLQELFQTFYSYREHWSSALSCV